MYVRAAFAVFVLLAASVPTALRAQALQGTAFTYQGELTQNGVPLNGSADLVFELFDAPTGGNAVGAPLAFTTANGNPAAVGNGIFSVALDFGAAAFAGPVARWLRVTVNGSVLAPRTKIENAPFALHARNAEIALDVPDGSIGSAEVNGAQVQLRGLTTTCGAGQFIRAIEADGDVLCAADESGPSPQYGFGILTIETAGVLMVSVDTAQVQARGTNTSCPSGSVVTGIDASGNVGCATDASGPTPQYGFGLLPVETGGVLTVSVDTAQVQARGTNTSCPIGTVVSAIGAGGDVSCVADANAGGDITGVTAGSGLTGGGASGSVALAADTNVVQSRVAATCPVESSIRQINPDGSVVCEADSFGATGTGWGLSGNAGTTAGANYLGTTDAVALEIKVQGARALRFEPTSQTSFSGRVNVVGGASVNAVTTGADGATIAGGGSSDSFGANRVTDSFGFVGGGANNRAGNDNAFSNDALGASVAGGSSNIASGDSSTVAGGNSNTASGTQAAIVGGQSNVASMTRAFVGGGVQNVASGINAVVAGGNANAASGLSSTVGGGAGNFVSGSNAMIGGGNSNRANGTMSSVLGGIGNTASGIGATVAGGMSNRAGGDHSFVAGRNAIVRDAAATGEPATCSNDSTCGDEGTFIFSDSSASGFVSDGPNRFLVRATGGVRFVSATDGMGNSTAGVQLAAGDGAWQNLSDRGAKTDFASIDPLGVLERVLALPISGWRYRAQDASVRHIGPVAQDFHAAFGLGNSERHISTVDADGVALAAIQGLNAKLEAELAALEAANARLAETNARLESEQRVLAERMAEIEASLRSPGATR